MRILQFVTNSTTVWMDCLTWCHVLLVLSMMTTVAPALGHMMLSGRNAKKKTENEVKIHVFNYILPMRKDSLDYSQ